MKKVLKSLALTGSMLAIAATAHAANTAQVTTTNPVFTKVGGCERIGSYTLKFDAGTTLTEGDYFYADLTANAKLCKTIDYFIAAGRNAGDTTDTIRFPSVTIDPVTNPYDVDLGAGGITAIPLIAAGASSGPLTNDVVSGAGANLTGTGGIVLHVYGAADSNRVTVTVLGTTVGVDTLTVPNASGTDVSSLTLHLVDGKRYTGSIVLNTGTHAGDTVWGNDAKDDIGLVNNAEYTVPRNEPNVEDTMCVKSAAVTADQIYTNHDSKDNFITFSGDSVIAHIGTAQVITLESCAAGIKDTTDVWGYIPMQSGQGATDCSLEYETAHNYCAHNDYNPFQGNRLILKSSVNSLGATTIPTSSDRYDMTLTLSTTVSGNGAYWSTNGAAVTGYFTSEDACDPLAGTPVDTLFANSSDSLGPWDDGSTCAVATGNRVTSISTRDSGIITNIARFARMWVDLPTIVYDKSIINTNNIELSVEINLTQYPCGTNVFDETQHIGTFVTTCPTATVTGSSTLLYPFLPAMDGSMTGWWAGFTIVNASSSAGECSLLFTDMDNDSATYTTPTIEAKGMWNGGSATDVLALLSSQAVGDNFVSIIANCNFDRAGGFAFVGNGNEGTGYTAYVLDPSGDRWQ